MKKMIIVLLSLVMVFAFVGAASAAITGNNETNAWGNIGPTYTTPGTTTGLRGGTAFVSGDPSPHQGYLSSTNKCEVCHSPHRAGTTGTTGGTSYKLLYGTTAASGATGSCVVCHVSTSLAIKNVYDASTGTMRGGHDLGAMSAGVPDTTWATDAASLGCSDCHSVHGAGAIGVGKPYILRSNPTWNGVAYSGTAKTDETGFCAACHDLNYATAANGITHYMGTTTDVNSTQGAIEVADTASTECDACHSAPKSTNNKTATAAKWPHQSVSIVGLGTGSSTSDVISQGSMDDHCLKCHSGIGTVY
jgi:hypothetical protein